MSFRLQFECLHKLKCSCLDASHNQVNAVHLWMQHGTDFVCIKISCILVSAKDGEHDDVQDDVLEDVSSDALPDDTGSLTVDDIVFGCVHPDDDAEMTTYGDVALG